MAELTAAAVVAIVGVAISAGATAYTLYTQESAPSEDERLKKVALPNQLTGLDKQIDKLSKQIAAQKAKGKDVSALETQLADLKSLKSTWLNKDGGADSNFASITDKTGGGGAPAPAPAPASNLTQLTKQVLPLIPILGLGLAAFFLFKKKK